MDNLQTWLYIILGIIYFIFQARSAQKKKAAEQAPKPSDTADNQPRKELKPEQQGKYSFEEILKEILNEEQSVAPEPKPQEANPKQNKKKYLPEPVKPNQTDRFSTPFRQKLTSNTPSLGDTEGQSLELLGENKGLEANYAQGSLFKEFEHKKGKINPYKTILSNPSSLKQAFVLKEILDRKFD